jgi:membrane protein implicated in regulation of membrane protease activity
MLLAIAILLTITVLSPRVGLAVIVIAAFVEVGEYLFWRRFLRRYRIRTGVEALVGEPVKVVEACDPVGRVRLRGELWNAHSERSLAVGETARVAGVDGLTIELAPAPEEATGAG